MPITIELPSEYGYVVAVATSTFFLNTAHGVMTSLARRSSGIKYPIAYAANDVAEKDHKAMLFNCAQRAHANYTENHTSFLGALMLAGLRWPVASSVLGLGWVVSRVLYFTGYATAGPEGRRRGAAGNTIFDLILKFMAAYTAYELVAAN